MAQYAAIMLVAGIGIPVLAALNAALGRLINSPTAAAVVLFTVALASSALVLLLFPGPGALSKVAGSPKHLFLGGVLVAFYVLSITHVAPHFGVGNAVFFVLLGQLISTAAIDHFGLFGAQVTPLTMARAGGIAVMAIGVAITQLA
ncbi:DMT family transporter [Ruegeria sediminis]|uniref:DMT family transporter n=1 Tax=Ruegeria sediminis TaxID=2583820 RepID=A0ABY2WYE5_9RHOB|nr:DMT family transporter [Ruegeria sediminis]TMV07885.1 DMT family transporter [Ruegeria sediminis]